MTPFGKIVFLVCIIYIYGAINLVPSKVAAEDVTDGEEQFERGQSSQVKRSSGTGAVFTRFGRGDCPDVSGTTLVYSGYAGGKWYDHPGTASNYLCLPTDPEYDVYKEGLQDARGRVYTGEYKTPDFPPYADMHNHDVPCAVCITTRQAVLMIPAKKSCPSGWTREYKGYLMSDRYDHTPTEFVCVVLNPQYVEGSIENRNGVLFYPVEGRCDGTHGNLPCSPYIHGAELSCVVCTK